MKTPDHPVDRFGDWLLKAKKSDPENYNACTLSTVGDSGCPSSRIVLLKHADQNGFVFYTNLNSRKSGDIRKNPGVSLCFFWAGLNRQVRVEGDAEPVSDAEADEYFQSRPRGHRIGAWASKQSEAYEGRELEQRVARFMAKYPVGPVPRPAFWGGFRIRPVAIEFWEKRNFRLHSRIRYEKNSDEWESSWSKSRLFP